MCRSLFENSLRAFFGKRTNINDIISLFFPDRFKRSFQYGLRVRFVFFNEDHVKPANIDNVLKTI